MKPNLSNERKVIQHGSRINRKDRTGVHDFRSRHDFPAQSVRSYPVTGPDRADRLALPVAMATTNMPSVGALGVPEGFVAMATHTHPRKG